MFIGQIMTNKFIQGSPIFRKLQRKASPCNQLGGWTIVSNGWMFDIHKMSDRSHYSRSRRCSSHDPKETVPAISIISYTKNDACRGGLHDCSSPGYLLPLFHEAVTNPDESHFLVQFHHSIHGSSLKSAGAQDPKWIFSRDGEWMVMAENYGLWMVLI